MSTVKINISKFEFTALIFEPFNFLLEFLPII
jgi:hypothetical protein